MTIVLVYHANRRWPKFRWVEEAMRRLGHEVRVARTAADLCREARGADVAIIEQKAAGCNKSDLARAIEACPCPVVQWWFDLIVLNDKPLASQTYICSLGDVLRACSLVLVKERDRLEEYQSLGINAEWMDQGCPRDMPRVDYDVEPEWDLLVYGTSGSSYRLRGNLVQRMLKLDYKVAWAFTGSGAVPSGAEGLPFTRPMELPGLASRARATLCVDYRHDIDGYWSDRVWLAMGMGACVARVESEGFAAPQACYREFFCHSELHRFVYEMRDATKVQRAAMGEAARKFVMGNHTYDHRCKEVIAKCETLLAA